MTGRIIPLHGDLHDEASALLPWYVTGRLNDDERRLYNDLRWRRLHDEPLRLEQERIPFGCVERAVAAVPS